MLVTKHIKDILDEEDFDKDFDEEEDFESTNTAEPDRFQLDEDIQRKYTSLRWNIPYYWYGRNDDAEGINVMTHVFALHDKHIVKAWFLQYLVPGICIKYPVLRVEKPITNYMFEFEFNNCLTCQITVVTNRRRYVLIQYSIEYSDELKKLNKEWNHKGVPPDLLLNAVKSYFLGTKFIIEQEIKP